MTPRAVVSLIAVALAGCGGDAMGTGGGFRPTGPLLLSAGSSTKDEDPSVLLGRDSAIYDDWVPTITQAPGGTLLVYFVSALRDTATHNSELYVATKPAGDTVWTAVAKVAGINSATEHDRLPFAARTGASVTLVWVRHDSTQAIPYLASKSHLWYSTSSDGLAWAAPLRITNDTDLVVHMFPALYADQARGGRSPDCTSASGCRGRTGRRMSTTGFSSSADGHRAPCPGARRLLACSKPQLARTERTRLDLMMIRTCTSVTPFGRRHAPLMRDAGRIAPKSAVTRRRAP